MPFEDFLHGYFRIGGELYLVKNFQGGGFTRLRFFHEAVDADPEAIYETSGALKDIPWIDVIQFNSIFCVDSAPQNLLFVGPNERLIWHTRFKLWSGH